MNTFRTLSITLLISIGLAACNDDTSVAPPEVVAVAVEIQNINSGMTEEAVTTQLGEATLSQSRTIDTLTFTQSE